MEHIAICANPDTPLCRHNERFQPVKHAADWRSAVDLVSENSPAIFIDHRVDDKLVQVADLQPLISLLHSTESELIVSASLSRAFVIASRRGVNNMRVWMDMRGTREIDTAHFMTVNDASVGDFFVSIGRTDILRLGKLSVIDDPAMPIGLRRVVCNGFLPVFIIRPRGADLKSILNRIQPV